MQVTFFFLYLFFYIVTLWAFLLSLTVCVPLFFFSHVSFATSFSFLKNYTKWNTLILTFFFLLSGLPPVGLFFIKLNILVYLLNKWNFYFLLVIFLILFFNMIFYLQVFKYKKGWTYLHSLFNSTLYTSTAATSNLSFIAQSKAFPLILQNYNNSFYSIMFWLISISLFLFFSLFFITDIYLIFMNFLFN